MSGAARPARFQRRSMEDSVGTRLALALVYGMGGGVAGMLLSIGAIIIVTVLFAPEDGMQMLLMPLLSAAGAILGLALGLIRRPQ